MPRCPWATVEPAIAYHDEEWAVPVHNDRMLFEFLILEGAQAGLSWITILKKTGELSESVRMDSRRRSPVLRRARDGAASSATLGSCAQPVLKIAAALTNAKAFLAVEEEPEASMPISWNSSAANQSKTSGGAMAQVPARTKETDAMSRDLLRRGFKFVGSTICYARGDAA